MGVVRRDYILRLIEQLGRALARIASLVAERKYDDALQTIGEAERELLGDDLRSLSRLDATSAVLLLHSDDRALGWALLRAERARALELIGQLTEARLEAQRALGLFSAVERRGAELTEVHRAARTRLTEAVERMVKG